MTNKMYSLVQLGFIALVSTLSMQAQADWLLVAGAKSQISKVSADEAVNLFLGKENELPGRGQVGVVDHPEGASVRDDFYTEAAKKSPSALKAYWSRMVFTGKGKPPKVLGDSEEVKKAVAANPALIGYIEKSALDVTVKVILSP